MFDLWEAGTLKSYSRTYLTSLPWNKIAAEFKDTGQYNYTISRSIVRCMLYGNKVIYVSWFCNCAWFIVIQWYMCPVATVLKPLSPKTENWFHPLEFIKFLFVLRQFSGNHCRTMFSISDYFPIVSHIVQRIVLLQWERDWCLVQMSSLGIIVVSCRVAYPIAPVCTLLDCSSQLNLHSVYIIKIKLLCEYIFKKLLL
jgi:hypothetical protein